MSNRTVTKPCTLKVNLPLSFSSMSNRAVTKQYIETFGISRSFSTMSNRTVTKLIFIVWVTPLVLVPCQIER